MSNEAPTSQFISNLLFILSNSMLTDNMVNIRMADLIHIINSKELYYFPATNDDVKEYAIKGFTYTGIIESNTSDNRILVYV